MIIMSGTARLIGFFSLSGLSSISREARRTAQYGTCVFIDHVNLTIQYRRKNKTRHESDEQRRISVRDDDDDDDYAADKTCTAKQYYGVLYCTDISSYSLHVTYST